MGKQFFAQGSISKKKISVIEILKAITGLEKQYLTLYCKNSISGILLGDLILNLHKYICQVLYKPIVISILKKRNE